MALACFAPLLRRVVAWWHPDHKQLPLVLDASIFGQRFTILAVCVIPTRFWCLPDGFRADAAVLTKVIHATQKWEPLTEGAPALSEMSQCC